MQLTAKSQAWIIVTYGFGIALFPDRGENEKTVFRQGNGGLLADSRGTSGDNHCFAVA
jgi:hypothetical protein